MYQVVLSNGKSFSSDGAASILDSARADGITLEYSCRTGRCGICKAPVLRGETHALRPEESLTKAQADAGIILTCCRAAGSDLELDVEDLGRLSDIAIKTMPCRIASIDYPAPTIARVSLRLPPTAEFRFLPGQFIDVIVAGHRRSYSIASAPRVDNVIDLMIRQVEGGQLSSYWFGAAKENDLLRFEGPLGTFFLREGATGQLIMLATGTGVAPIRAMLQEMTDAQIKAAALRIYWGNRVPEDFFCDLRAEFPGVVVVQVLSGGDANWTGRRGHVQAALLEDVDDFSGASVYACGSEAMIRQSEQMLVQAGLSARRFFSDAFLSSN